MKESVLIITGFLFLCSIEYAFGCFITNCPPGGKRSGADIKLRQCETCGPPGMNGQCYGPHICCSSTEGCLVGTPETSVCLTENLHTTPCQNSGDSCSGNDDANPINGHCAAFGFCCSSETCTADINCQNREDGQFNFKSFPPFMKTYKHSGSGLGFNGLRKPLRILPPSEMQRQIQMNQNPFLDRVLSLSHEHEGNKASNEEY